MKSQLRVLDLSQSAWGFPAQDWPTQGYYVENNDVLEKLLFSCCSLQRLEMEGLHVTSTMGIGICKNGKTLQVLNLNHSIVNDKLYTYCRVRQVISRRPNFQSIIKCCQELKELDLNYINGRDGLSDDNLKFLAENLATNVEKLNLSNQNVEDDHVKMLLSRCNKIKILFLETLFLSNDSLKVIRQYLNLTLEELNLVYYGHQSRARFLQLKSMVRLKILNLYDHRDLD